MKILFVFFLTLAAAFAGGPQFEQGYVSTLAGTKVQAVNEFLLPTAVTVEELAMKFNAKIAVRTMDGGQWKYWVPLEPLPAGWQWQFDFVAPFVKTKPAIERSLMFAKGTKLPSGYVLKGEVSVPAWFFAYAYIRLPEALAEKTCWEMVETHELQSIK